MEKKVCNAVFAGKPVQDGTYLPKKYSHKEWDSRAALIVVAVKATAELQFGVSFSKQGVCCF